jgi:hypothetical protein
MTRPAKRPITIYQRASFRLRIRLPFNLNGYTIVSQVWSRRREELLLDFEVRWLDRPNGLFELYANRAETRQMTRSGEWDLLVIQPDGDGFYWLEGPATLDPGQSDDI